MSQHFVLRDGIGYTQRADGALESATPGQYVAEILRLRHALEETARIVKDAVGVWTP